MDSKNILFTKIISIVSLVVLGYIFFISVYNQIIVQSGGVFYIVIFGGILILAFVLLSLVTKLIEITREIKDNFMWNFVEILLLCNLAYLFFAFRLAYKSTVPAEETVLYRTAQLMSEGELSTKGMDMFRHLIIFPSQYVYAFVVSLFIKISDSGSQTMITVNAFVLILTAFVMDRVVRKIAGRACGIIAALCTLFIPSQSFAVYSYSGEFFFCLILLLFMDIFLLLLNAKEQEGGKLLAFYALAGAVAALLCFIEPLMLICIIPLAVYLFKCRKEEGEDIIKPIAVMAAVTVIILVLFTLIKSVSLNTDIGSVISGSVSRYRLTRNPETEEKYTFGDVFEHFHENLDNQNTNVNDNYHFLVNDEGEAYTQTHNAWFSLGTQMSYMFVIVMSIACAFYMFKSKRSEAVPGFILLLGCFIVLFFRSAAENSTYFLFEILIIVASSGLSYMYMNHHPELSMLTDGKDGDKTMANTIADRDISEWGAIARARALIFAGKDNNADQAAVNSGTGNRQAAPGQNAEHKQTGQIFGEANVSPEGYFSFFASAPQSVPVQPAPVQESIQSVNEAQYGQEQEKEYANTVTEYTEPVSEYAEPVTEYTEPVSEYIEPVTEFEEPVSEYEEPVEEYGESVKEYREPESDYTGQVTEYEEPASEYAGQVTEYEEPVSEYAGQVTEYEENVTEYEEPALEYAGEAAGYDESESEYAGEVTEYEESVTEYEEPAVEYEDAFVEYAEPVGEYEEAGSEYAESAAEYEEQAEGYTEEVSSYEEPVSEYAEPLSEYEEPAENRSNENSAKTSYGNAAHALGFSFTNDLFADMGYGQDPDENDNYGYTEMKESIQSGAVSEGPDMEEPEFDIFGNEIPYEEEIQHTETDDAHKPYYASEDEEVQDTQQLPAYEFGANYDQDVDEFSFGEGMPQMYTFEEQREENNVLNDETGQYKGEADAQEKSLKKKKVVKKIVRRVVKKPQGAAPVNISAEFRQDTALENIASGYDDSFGTVENNPVQSEGMPDLIVENYHSLAQANVPVSSDEPDISELVFDEADSRYNIDDLGSWGEDGDGDSDNGGSSGYIIEI